MKLQYLVQNNSESHWKLYCTSLFFFRIHVDGYVRLMTGGFNST